MLVSTFTTLHELALDFGDSLEIKSDNELQSAIFKTLAYFDIFDYPLTDWEIYKYLWVKDLPEKKVDYGKVRDALNNNLPNIKKERGFYFLEHQEEITAWRKERQLIANEKYKFAGRVAKILSVLPFIKMIAVCNTLAYDNAREESDIDLFIITSKNKVWTVRFYATLLLKIFKLRPTAENKKNKICLNFMIDESALNLEELLIKDDIYFIYWLKQLLPVYTEGYIFSEFVRQNDFINNYLNNNAPGNFFNKRKVENNIFADGIKSFLEVAHSWSFLEKIFRAFQLRIMPQKLLDKVGSTEVVINDSVLKFHQDDKREEFRNIWSLVTSNQ